MLFCRKCGEKNDGEAKFCIKCGAELHREAKKEISKKKEAKKKVKEVVTEKAQEKKKSSKKWWFIVPLIIIVLIFLFMAFTGYFGVKSYTCRGVQVPYEDIEYHTESEPYIDETCIPKYMDGGIGKFYDFGGEERETTGALTVINEETRNEPIKYYVENFENRAGTFEVYAIFMEDCAGGYCGLPAKSVLIDTFKINANSRKIAYFYMDSIWDKIPRGANAIMLDEDGEEYQDCEKTTRYRDVEKSRTVTKYRTEQQCS